MRIPSRRWLLPVLLLMSAAAQVDAAQAKLSSRQCGFSTPYDVLADNGGIWLRRAHGTPQEVFFHDGRLSVDHQVRAVSDADAQRLRQLESGTRALMPAVATIARESVGIAFDAFAGVTEAMTGSKRKARQLDRYRADALALVDASIGKGRWEQDLFDERFQASIEKAAEDMAGSIGRSALLAVFTGGAGRLERRSEQMERDLEQRMDARSEALEAQAQALCGQVERLHALQQALEFRLDGEPLRLLELDPGDAALAGAVVRH